MVKDWGVQSSRQGDKSGKVCFRWVTCTLARCYSLSWCSFTIAVFHFTLITSLPTLFWFHTRCWSCSAGRHVHWNSKTANAATALGMMKLWQFLLSFPSQLNIIFNINNNGTTNITIYWERWTYINVHNLCKPGSSNFTPKHDGCLHTSHLQNLTTYNWTASPPLAYLTATGLPHSHMSLAFLIVTHLPLAFLTATCH